MSRRIEGTVNAAELPEPTVPRRIVQIAPVQDGGLFILFALADDGTIWRTVRPKGNTEPIGWSRLPQLPPKTPTP